MPNLREAYGGVKRYIQGVNSRIKPEGQGISLGLALGSGYLITATQLALTGVLHEGLKNSDLTAVGLVAFGLLAATNAISVAIEIKTLKEKGFSNNPPSNFLYVATGNPYVSAIGSHLYHIALHSVLNPGHFFNMSSLEEDQGRLLMESTGSVNSVLASWNIVTNTLIRKGKIDPVIDSMKAARNVTVGWAKNRIDGWRGKIKK